jgi:hypothetical protein
MPENKLKSIYEILTTIIKFRLGSLKESGIELNGIYKMINLQSGKEFYKLVVNDKEIVFTNGYSFAYHFSKFLESNIKYYNQRFDELTNIQINDFTDNIAIEMKYKEIDHYRYKQKEILGKLIEVRNSLKPD